MNLSIASIVCFLAFAAPAPPSHSAKPATPKKSASAAKTAPAKTPAVPAGNPRVAIDTNKGRIVAELYASKAPKTVKNFLDYVKAGHYNGTIFHRVIPGFMIQGGGFTASLIEKPTKGPIPNEADNQELNQRGTLAMARTSDPNSATAQFFINVANNGFLNFRSKTPDGWGYAVFGNVVEGMDVVDAIAQVQTTSKGMLENLPNQPVVIQKVTLLPPAKPAAQQ